MSASQAKIQKKLEIIHKSGIFNMKFGANNCIMVGFCCESLSAFVVKFVYIIIVHPPYSEKHGVKLGLSLVKIRTFNSVNPQFPQSKTLVLQLIEYQTDMFLPTQ